MYLLVALYLLMQAVGANCAAPGDFCQSIHSEIAYSNPDQQLAYQLSDFGEWVDNILYPLLVQAGFSVGSDWTPNYAYGYAKLLQRLYFRLVEREYWIVFYAERFPGIPL